MIICFNQPITSIHPTAGHFGKLRAKRFCMSVHNSVISGSMYDAEKVAIMQDGDARFVVFERAV